jgi:hypothetical protein
MGSMNTKRAAAVVTLAASIMIGGAAFSPANATVTDYPVGGPDAVVVTTISDADQTMPNGPAGTIGDPYATAVGVLSDGKGQTDQPSASAHNPAALPQRPAIWGYDPINAVENAYAAVVYALKDVNR